VPPQATQDRASSSASREQIVHCFVMGVLVARSLEAVDLDSTAHRDSVRFTVDEFCRSPRAMD